MEKALKIAEMLETLCTNPNNGEVTFAVNPLMDVAVTIRDLVDKLDKSEPAILDAFNSGKGVGYVDGMQKQMQSSVDRWVNATAPQTKPLSVEEIEGAFYKKCWYYDEDEKFDYYGFAREIEERHGIYVQKT